MKLPTKKRERAAQLCAEDRLSDCKIAAEVEISERALAKWKKDPIFAARVTELTSAYADRVLKFGLARREKRIETLSDMHDKVLAVIDERATDETMVNVPGGKTGLMVRQLKVNGKGGGVQVMEQFAVDTPLLRELRGIEEQIARELGQWKERQEVEVTGLAERLQRARERVAKHRGQQE